MTRNIGQVAIIGAGSMGAAVLAGLLRRKLVRPGALIATGPRKERLAKLRAEFGVRVTTSNRKAVSAAEIVVLAVKPQSLTAVARDIEGQIQEGALVISVLAGRTIAEVSRLVKHDCVVRAMPNTPAQIGEGISVWTAAPQVSSKQRQQAALVLGACGEEIFVEHESYLDMATALSGNGPAYVFLFLEALVDAGVHIGFPRHVAEKLVLQTVKGSAAYVMESPRHLAGLRNEVTSPGGTSAEALYYLEKAGFRTALARAVWAGYERSLQLGRGEVRARLGSAED